jgi:transcriptional regulator with XRE-family HTH domain
MDILLERIIECIGPRHGAKKELAEHLGIHPNVITNWLNGRNKSYRRYVNEIAAFYGVSVDYLLGNADSKEKQPDSQNENQAVKDELIAFYGDVKDDLTPDDIDDLMVAMRAKAERINAQRIEEAQQAAGVAEPVNTWAGWKAAGYMVEHGAKALFQAVLIHSSKGDGQTYRASFFAASQVKPLPTA